MAQLQVPLDNALMAKLKAAAHKAGKTLRVFVEDMIKQAVAR